MKASPQLLSCLLIASVALLNGGAAWSDTQANKSQAKSSAKVPTKKAKKPRAKVKPTAKAPASNVQPTAAENPYLPGSTAPIAGKPNPYLPGAAVSTASAPNPYVPAAVPVAPAAPLTLAKSTSLAASVPAMDTTAATPEPVASSRAGATAAPIPAATSPAPAAAVAAAVAAATPVAAAVPAPQQKAASPAQPAGNPYLAYNPYQTYNPYLANSVAFNQAASPVNTTNSLNQLFSDLKYYLPTLPTSDQAILPTIKKVQPTGEKPLYVLTFKCPTELVGITPPTTKALRWLISSGMEALNSTNLLPFNMQQVCQ